MGAPTVVASNTTLADGTEQVLLENTISEHYTVSINKQNMQAGDTIEIRFYKKVLTGSTQDLIEEPWTFSGVQTVKVFYLPHISCPFGCKVTLKQTAGTNRNYDWSIEHP